MTNVTKQGASSGHNTDGAVVENGQGDGGKD